MVLKNIEDLEALEYLKMRKSPIYWTQQTYGLVPQPLKPEYQSRFVFGALMRGKLWDEFCKTVRPYWFEEFRPGFHITWQQFLLFTTVEKALRGEVPRKISVVSGRGTGKSSGMSILTLWFLFVFEDARIAATGPTSDNLFDVLWAEIARWIQKMPEGMKALYEWQATHVRMKESPETWFARAKTASKETPEALSGIHADNLMLLADEASGIESYALFEAAEGALTNDNYLFIMISQGTRGVGYFFDSHHKNAILWVNLSFSSAESPIVKAGFVDGVIHTHGLDSPSYRIQVEGGFPDEGIMDDQGYVQLFNASDLHIVPFEAEWKPVGRTKGALDASGEGQDTSEWGIRDRMRAAIVASEQTSTPMSMSLKSITLVDKYDVDPIDFVIDAFGKGHQVSQEIALATAKQQRPWRVWPINVGDPCEDLEDREQFINVRAMCYYRMMLWCRSGGELMESAGLREELLSIRFKRSANGRIQIMPKEQMQKMGFKSPNKADALSMTFFRRDSPLDVKSFLGNEQSQKVKVDFDPHATM